MDECQRWGDLHKGNGCFDIAGREGALGQRAHRQRSWLAGQLDAFQ